MRDRLLFKWKVLSLSFVELRFDFFFDEIDVFCFFLRMKCEGVVIFLSLVGLDVLGC